MSNLQEFHGLPVFDFPEAGEKAELPAAAAVAWRIAVDGYGDSEDEEWEDAFKRFVATVDTTAVRALVVGVWKEAYDSGPDSLIAAVAGAGERFPALRALFLGDISFDECEISWINQGHVNPLLDAFPLLEEFGVRGGQALVFEPVRHERLRSLTVETGGLGREVVQGIASSDLPALEHLDLWLGTSEYGADAGIQEFEPFFSGVRLPRLTHLALRNSDMQDVVARSLAGAPVVGRLESLDLSMGTLSDEGAEALLNGQPLTHLKKLNLHHHYLSESMVERIATTLGASGVEVDLSESLFSEWDRNSDWDNRYVSVGE
ncbi:STM4015 family protein [Streptomyces sp. NPDC017979]|uniref:STM4015 family protein n=1 Tax=Streptomyces sp. NPDC017979 TaxID=3365024 RepID=UPI00379591D1